VRRRGEGTYTKVSGNPFFRCDFAVPDICRVENNDNDASDETKPCEERLEICQVGGHVRVELCVVAQIEVVAMIGPAGIHFWVFTVTFDPDVVSSSTSIGVESKI